ncbi:MAG: SGNH/GDSL hydrolase family protein, partial [Nocardioides sp.]|nr:SGNH/GDSL hydrolase family protein [Nocardioides sp.]
MRRRLAGVIGLIGVVLGALVGLLAFQGRHVQRTMVRLPEAKDPEGVAGAGDPWRLVVIGDSVAAGVGVEHHGISLVGRLAEQLAVGRSVRR